MTTRAILFDLYGTLVDDGPTVWDPVVLPMAAALNLPVEDFRRAWVATWPQRGSGKVKTTEENLLHIISSLQVDGRRDSHPFPIPMGKHALEQSEGDRMGPAVARAADIFRAHLKHVLTPRPDALALLTTLKARGYPLALISNIALEAPAIWSATATNRYFDFAAYSSHLGLMKPDPGIFQTAFDALHVTPEQCVYIADGNDREMETVQALNMPGLLIRTNYTVPNSFRLTHEQWPAPASRHSARCWSTSMLDLPDSRRIHLIGSMVSGKSTTAHRLADRLGLVFIELDGIRHQPNWTVKSDAAFRADVQAALDAAPHGWVAAGHYLTELGTTVIGQADTVLWLRLPFYQTFPRLFLRSVKRCWTREPLWNGYRESWRVVFLSRYSPLLEAWQKRHGGIAFFTGILNSLSPRPQLIVLNSYKEIEGLMRDLVLARHARQS